MRCPNARKYRAYCGGMSRLAFKSLSCRHTSKNTTSKDAYRSGRGGGILVRFDNSGHHCWVVEANMNWAVSRSFFRKSQRNSAGRFLIAVRSLDIVVYA